MEPNFIFEIGKSKELSKKEIISLSSESNIVDNVDSYFLLQEINDDLLTLGGTIKWFEIVGESKSLEDIYEGILNDIGYPEGKVVLALDWALKNRRSFSLKVKAKLKDAGISVSIIGHRDSKYNSTGAIIQRKVLKKGAFYLILEYKNKYLLAKCIKVQDIANFEIKDYKKPIRDMQRGMMPPKLARMLLNIARGEFNKLGINNKPIVWDPFCGLGSTALECIDLSIDSISSDNSKDAIDGSIKNINWYKQTVQKNCLSEVFLYDAKDLLTEFNPNIICGEGYLGEIITSHKISTEFIEI